MKEQKPCCGGSSGCLIPLLFAGLLLLLVATAAIGLFAAFWGMRFSVSAAPIPVNFPSLKPPFSSGALIVVAVALGLLLLFLLLILLLCCCCRGRGSGLDPLRALLSLLPFANLRRALLDAATALSLTKSAVDTCSQKLAEISGKLSTLSTTIGTIPVPNANFETRSIWDVLSDAGVHVPHGTGSFYVVTSGTLSTSTPFSAAQQPIDDTRLKVDTLKKAADDVSKELLTMSQSLSTIANALPQTPP